ncbi:MAG: carbohydrate-binding domain-containing protein, partial [Clostridiales bacterium]|nr:carbohydrate-binding domain-containing protein [Clostridiales bacterium]
MKKRTAAVWLLVFAMALLQGCSAAAGTQQEEINPSAQTLSAADESMITDRDREIGYSEAGSSLIKLKDGASSADGAGVSIEESTITISEEGTYILSGSLSNGQIIVDAPESAKIQLVLNGVEISNKSTAPIYVRKADKVFITTAKGTANTLSVTGEYEAIDDNNIDAVVFSKSDLTLNGAGTININAAYGHGVVSKDDLAVTCGNYKISAEKHGLSGKNSVRIAGGSFDITCTEDGIHSENTDDETLGFVYIEDGNFDISAGDDGVHASNYAKILGGNIKISKSYEGIEGLTIDISGGEISV